MNGLAKTFAPGIALLAWHALCVRAADLDLVPDAQAQHVFAGGDRVITSTWHNNANRTLSVPIRAQLYQTSSATAALFDQFPWKTLTVLPGQTVIERASVSFPPLNAATQFVIRWLDDASNVLGATLVIVHPTNQLHELGLLAGEEGIGVLDPQNIVKPLLEAQGIAYVDLERYAADFSGKLALLGPASAEDQSRAGFEQAAENLSKRGIAVLWASPEDFARDKLVPTFYTVSGNKAPVTIVHPPLLEDLADNPRSQWNLVHLARITLKPEALTLPRTEPRH